MNPLLLGGLMDVAKAIIGRIWPDPAQQAEAQMKLLQLQQTGELAQLAAETDLAKLQIQTNIEEAKSPNWFVAGWRPFIGWSCGAGLAYVALFEPIARFVAKVGFGYEGGFPVIDTSLTTQVLMGMLGIGGMRTLEKLKDAEKNR